MEKDCRYCDSVDCTPFYIQRKNSVLAPEYDVVYLCSNHRIHHNYLTIQDISEDELESYLLLVQ
jgi:hypothetical protein